MTLEEYIVKYGEREGSERFRKNEAHKKYRQTQAGIAKQNEARSRYLQTPKGRAQRLVSDYRKLDKRYERGECTLSVQWIIDHIFSKHCLYCGESDWHLLGCDRINNDKPHTPNNVVCCCSECNTKRMRKDFLEFSYSIGARDSDYLTIKY